MSSLIVLGLFSCEKENFDANSETQKTKGFKILSYRYTDSNARGIENNILSFDSEEEYDTTLDSLQNAYDEYSTDFTNSVKDMTDEAINDKISSENIDLELPLTNFEKKYQFISLRNEINVQEKLWLSNPNPDFTLCPQVHSIASFAERSLWNKDGEVMVGGKIYKYNQDDTKYIVINDGSFLKLAMLNSGNTSILADSMVSVVDVTPENNSTTVVSTNSLNCTSVSGNSVDYSVQFVYKVICSNRLKKKDWSFGKHVLSAGTVTYKLRTNVYQRFATTLQLNLFGERYNNCGDNSTPVTGLSKLIVNSAVSVELKRNYQISTKYNSNSCSINSHHAAGNIGVDYFPVFETNLRLKY